MSGYHEGFTEGYAQGVEDSKATMARLVKDFIGTSEQAKENRRIISEMAQQVKKEYPEGSTATEAALNWDEDRRAGKECK